MDLEGRLHSAIQSCNAQKVEKVFEQIYHKYSQLVGYVVSKYVANPHDIEELVDDVFVSFSGEMFKTEFRSIKYYLVVSAKNRAVNFVRKNFGKEIVYTEDIKRDSVMAVSPNTAFWEAVSEMQQYLTAREINIVLQHAVFDYTFAELAKMHNCPISTVNSLYSRAIKKFRSVTKL